MKLGSVFSAMLMISSTVFAGYDKNEIYTPITLAPALAIEDTQAINKFLISLVYEHEVDGEMTHGPKLDSQICELKTPQLLVCKFDYIFDSFNGMVDAQFKIESNKLVELTEITFDGDY